MRYKMLFLTTIVVILTIWTGFAVAQEGKCTPDAIFVADVTVPDDSVLAPGEGFEKVWRLKNTGGCPWDEDYTLSFIEGERFNAPESQALGRIVDVGGSVDITMAMQAPFNEGTYTGWWQMKDPGGKPFGPKIYVRIIVRKPGQEPAAAQAEPTEEAPAPQPTEEAPVLAGKIAFTVLNTTYRPRPLYDLYVADIDGSNRQLIAQGMRQPSMRGDGMILANADGLPNQENLYVMNLDGSGQREISVFADDDHPDWSPDGGRIVFSNLGNKGLIVQDGLARDATRHPLFHQYFGLQGRHPVWLPDGRILYNGCDVWATSGSCGLYIADLSGSQPVQLTSSPDDLAPAASSNRVAFMSHRDGNWEIHAVDVQGSRLTRLTDNLANDGLPTWSPKGHMIAFLSDRDGSWAIWAMNSDGSGQRKLFDLGGPMGDDWMNERLSWGLWPEGLAVPPTPTPVPVPTSTPYIGIRNTTFFDGFSDPATGLPNDSPQSSCGGRYENGQYHMFVQRQNYGCDKLYRSDYTYFTLEVDLGLLSGEGWAGGAAGVTFGNKGGMIYDFWVSRVGDHWGHARYFVLWKRLRTGEWVDIKPWLVGGGLNGPDLSGVVYDHLKVVVKETSEGARMEMYANDKMLDWALDPEYQGGAIGLSIRTFGSDAYATFDNLRVEPF